MRWRRDAGSNKIAAERIRDGERIDVGAISGAKPAFEVDRPFADGVNCTGNDLALIDGTPPEFRCDYPLAIQDAADGGGCRPGHVGSVHRNASLDFLGPEARKKGTQGNNCGNRLRRRCMRARTRHPVSVFKPGWIAAIAPTKPSDLAAQLEKA